MHRKITLARTGRPCASNHFCKIVYEIIVWLAADTVFLLTCMKENKIKKFIKEK